MIKNKPIKPVIFGNYGLNLNMIILFAGVLLIVGLTALFIARYSAERFNADKRKTAIGFILLAVVFSALMLCFFGLSAIAVRGIILSIVFILSSIEDIKTRECDDYLHLMIVIAGFIGIELSALPGMLISAFAVFALMMGAVLITKSEIGGADIKISVACAFMLGLRRGLTGLALGMILAVLLNLFRNKNERKTGFPMIPYLAVGFLTAYFI